MTTPMLDYVLGQLADEKGRLPRVAERSGVPYRTLQKIASGKTKNPSINHIQALHDYFVRARQPQLPASTGAAA